MSNNQDNDNKDNSINKNSKKSLTLQRNLLRRKGKLATGSHTIQKKGGKRLNQD